MVLTLRIVEGGAAVEDMQVIIRRDPGVLRGNAQEYELHNVSVRNHPELRHSISVLPGTSMLGITALVTCNIAKMRGEPAIKEQAACVQRRPCRGDAIRVTADPLQDEWTGFMIGTVNDLHADYFTLDIGDGDVWDINYTNKWEILE